MELRYWLVPGNVKNNRINKLNEKHSLIPWGLRVRFEKLILRLSVLPWYRERPQTAICCLEWLGKYSSSHPSHVKNCIPYSQFLRLHHLFSEDSDFSLKSEEMCDFFNKHGYLASVVQAGHHRAQQIDRQLALQTSHKENNNRIPFTLTFHPHNQAVKSIILKNFKLLQNDPDTGRIFSQPPLISFKCDKT